ncbi:MAG: hypothetical protein LBB07_00010 [Bifidobacteriaceae bacterium]|jgi:hypothetical protein|nr:hypothetical protein [Bifidobacteriaceae bacterium]
MEYIGAEYIKEFRKLLGFNTQSDTKRFFKAGDILPSINYEYIEKLNYRLTEIIVKINNVVMDDEKLDCNGLKDFIVNNVYKSYEKIKENGILPRLNNQGRRPEEVYYSWMRGFVIMNYFAKPLAQMFNASVNEISISGDDDLNSIDTFRRTPSADLELDTKFGKIRLEIQSGFTGINDIKQHKVVEAKRLANEQQIITLVVHFDIYNGQVAIVRIDNIDDNNLNWITRQQMEGQTVFNINQNYFCWKLTEKRPSFREIEELINAE